MKNAHLLLLTSQRNCFAVIACIVVSTVCGQTPDLLSTSEIQAAIAGNGKNHHIHLTDAGGNFLRDMVVGLDCSSPSRRRTLMRLYCCGTGFRLMIAILRGMLTEKHPNQIAETSKESIGKLQSLVDVCGGNGSSRARNGRSVRPSASLISTKRKAP